MGRGRGPPRPREEGRGPPETSSRGAGTQETVGGYGVSASERSPPATSPLREGRRADGTGRSNKRLEGDARSGPGMTKISAGAYSSEGPWADGTGGGWRDQKSERE